MQVQDVHIKGSDQRAGNALLGPGLNWPHSNIYLLDIEGGATKDSQMTESNQALVRRTIGSNHIQLNGKMV